MSGAVVTMPRRASAVLAAVRARATLLALATGHMGADFSQGAVAAMLPFLRDHRGYSYAQGTALVLAMSLGTSLAQPPFGHLTDRRRVPALAPLGVMVAAASIAMLGEIRDHALLFVVVLVGGFGVAAFHPAGARVAARASGDRRAVGMSIFQTGGNIGFALAPAVVALLVGGLGLRGTLLVACVPLAAACVLAVVLARHRALIAAAEHAASAHGHGEDRWSAFWRLAASATLRSGVYFGLQSFVPAYFVARFGASSATGDAALTLILVAGVGGTLVGGQLAEVVGRRLVLIGSLCMVPPLMALALLAGEWLAFPLLALVGFFAIANMTVTVVMGQEYLPSRLGTASGVMLGLTISAGGGIAALFGMLADATSPRTVLWVLCVLPLPAIAVALGLPDTRPRPAAPVAATA
ncbi:MAG TPA: MFS transporter [Solirubrobacteraceae bacterium]|jgi:FSR family fosmidomycin resistance protein-like MFS transporter|nr:MFS transporter [Solirubrobacteraceae bacterium]